MNKIKKLSTAGTIISLISLIGYIVVAVWINLETSDLFMDLTNDSMDKLGQVDSNSPSAGYEVIAYLAGGALGFLGGLFLLLFTLFLLFLAFYQIPAIISGFLANRRYKKGDEIHRCLKLYKIDGFIKVIMNGIVVVICVLLIIGDMAISSIKDNLIVIICMWNFVSVFILSIFQIQNVNIVGNTGKNEYGFKNQL